VYDFGKPYGESCYRLMSRTGQFIYLRTRGSLEIDEKTRQVHSFVCVNSLVSDDEGRRMTRDMKKKFSAIISEAELSAMESNIAALETPVKLESAILNLITNLNNRAAYDDDNISLVSDSTIEAEDTRRRSPPLSIIAPKLNTIKTSITKAVAVIGHKSQSPTIKDEPKSPESSPHQSMPSPNIKREPNNVLSPTSSSMSSIDSEASSPFLPQNTQQTPKYTTQQVQANSNNGYFTPFDNLPTFDAGTGSSATNDSIMIASNVNNNNSNNNRNSVLKRTYNSTDDDDYTELIKKRTLDVHNNLHSPLEETTNTALDLLETSGEGEEGYFFELFLLVLAMFAMRFWMKVVRIFRF
jgi:hypothetical protein